MLKRESTTISYLKVALCSNQIGSTVKCHCCHTASFFSTEGSKRLRKGTGRLFGYDDDDCRSVELEVPYEYRREVSLR